MIRTVLATILVLTTTSIVAAQADEALARYISKKTMAVVHLKVQELLKVPATRELMKSVPGYLEGLEQTCQESLGLTIADVTRLTFLTDELIITPREPVPGTTYFLLQTSKPINYASLRGKVARDSPTMPVGKYEMTAGQDVALVKINDNTALILMNYRMGTLPSLSFLQSQVEPPQVWKPLLEEAAKSPLFLGMVMPASVKTYLESNAQQLPPALAPLKGLIALQTAYLSMKHQPEQPADCPLTLQASFPDGPSAQKGLAAIKFGIASYKMFVSSFVNKEPPADLLNFWGYAASFFRKQLDTIKVEQRENEVVVNWPMKSQEVLPVLVLLTEKVRLAADKMLSASNMRQLMIAMHNFHTDYKRLPDVMTMKEGKPLHSWRVLILSYIGEDNLRTSLKLDEPWDSPHNLPLLEAAPMPKVFEHPRLKGGDKKLTYYQVFYSKKTMPREAAFVLGRKLTLGQLTAKDGTSNTIAMIETAQAVRWFEPVDIEFDASQPFPKLKSPWPIKLVNVCFFDGSIRTADLEGDGEIWKQLVTWRGGERPEVSKVID